MGDAQVEDLLTILIGCLGVFVGMMILMGNQWDFGRREGMHLSAMVDLESLGDRIRFSKMNRAMNEEREGKSGSGSRSGSNGAGTGSGASVSSGRSADYGGERKALGTVENSDRKLALVVASGKTLKKVESAIEKKTKEVKKANDSRSDVARLVTLSCSLFVIGFVYCRMFWKFFKRLHRATRMKFPFIELAMSNLCHCRSKSGEKLKFSRLSCQHDFL